MKPMYMLLCVLSLLLATTTADNLSRMMRREYQVQKHCLRLCTLTLSPAVYCGRGCSCFMLGRFFGMCIDPYRRFPKTIVGSHYNLFSRY
uniref:Putative conserved secreted protein n=1 Tax=Amblyomma tuberculatum TaxID=48802 RepID=A0A6M2E3Y2_9ACAR